MSPSADEELEPGRQLAAEVRAVIDDLVRREPGPETVAAVRSQLAALRATMREAPERPPRWKAPAPDGRRGATTDWLPVGGAANPVAPPLVVRVEDDTVVGEVTYGAAYEGPPGCVHGGMIAAAFDEVLGVAQSLSGGFGMTGTLSVRYQRPTPLHVPLRVIGRFDRAEGRKLFTKGQIEVGDQVTATAEAVFIRLDDARFAEVAAAAARAAEG